MAFLDSTGLQYFYSLLKPLRFADVVVPVSAWASHTDVESENYPYRAAIALSGVTDTMFPDVVFCQTDADSGIYAKTAYSYNGGIYLYASEIPTAAIVLPIVNLVR